jgi:hypothetical protein
MNIEKFKRVRFGPGSVVYVKGYKRQGRRIVTRIIGDVEGGRVLDAPVDNFRCWNIADLKAWVRR